MSDDPPEGREIRMGSERESKESMLLARLDVLTQPLCHGQDVTQGQFFKSRIAGLNSEFLFS